VAAATAHLRPLLCFEPQLGPVVHQNGEQLLVLLELGGHFLGHGLSRSRALQQLDLTCRRRPSPVQLQEDDVERPRQLAQRHLLMAAKQRVRRCRAVEAGPGAAARMLRGLQAHEANEATQQHPLRACEPDCVWVSGQRARARATRRVRLLASLVLAYLGSGHDLQTASTLDLLGSVIGERGGTLHAPDASGWNVTSLKATGHQRWCRLTSQGRPPTQLVTPAAQVLPRWPAMGTGRHAPSAPTRPPLRGNNAGKNIRAPRPANALSVPTGPTSDLVSAANPSGRRPPLPAVLFFPSPPPRLLRGWGGSARRQGLRRWRTWLPRTNLLSFWSSSMGSRPNSCPRTKPRSAHGGWPRRVRERRSRQPSKCWPILHGRWCWAAWARLSGARRTRSRA
jgi:hypothetical protein